jgi:hypothetical protein
MDSPRRSAYNRAFSDEFFARYHRYMESAVGPFPFRLAETPLFLTHELRDELGKNSEEIIGQLSKPDVLPQLMKAIPDRYRAPGMDALPHCVQVDFALVQGADGKLTGKLVELQAFPSLYALETLFADAWAHVFTTVPGLEGPWTCFYEGTRAENVEVMRKALLDGNDPEEVVLADYEPERQKTLPDFVATKKLFDVNTVCVTKLFKEGNRLYRDSGGRKVPVKRIYNRMVFDELAVKGVEMPFDWRDELDVTWCSHPNWYWAWSKYSLPFLDHPSVPRTRFLSDAGDLSDAELHHYVLKPLFSFAGSGVVIDVTRETLARIPASERHNYILQEKFEYAAALPMPDGNGVKAEVRVMAMRHSLDGARPLIPMLYLVRMSRGKMLGVDFNKNLTWVGGTVALWTAT